MMKRLFALGIAVVMLGGCAFFSTPPSTPVVEDKVGSSDVEGNDKRIGTLATVAQRRLAYIEFEDGRFCAEPPPDVADNIAATLSAALSGGTGSVTVNAQMATAIATLAKQLFIDGPTFQRKHKEILDVAKELINNELQYLKDIKADTSGTPTPSNPPALNPPSPPQPAASNLPAGGTTSPGK